MNKILDNREGFQYDCALRKINTGQDLLRLTRVVFLFNFKIVCIKTGSSKNSMSEISNPRAIIITVLRVTVLFLPFIIHCILPCCIPDFCSKRYWDIFFSSSSFKIRFTTALFTVTVMSLLFALRPFLVVCLYCINYLLKI